MFSPDSDDRNTTRPPVALQHCGHVGARQPDAGHHIDLEEPGPFTVGNLEEVLRAIDADIVDENVASRLRLHKRIATAGGREVSRDPTNLGLWCALPHGSNRFIDGTPIAPVDHDCRTASHKTTCNREADTTGGAGYNRSLARKVDLQMSLLVTAPLPRPLLCGAAAAP